MEMKLFLTMKTVKTTNVKSDSRGGFFLRLLLRTPPPMASSRGVVSRRCNRPRVRPPAADLVMKTLAVVYNDNYPALPSSQSREGHEKY